MRTRSQARRRRQPQVRQTSVESSNLEKPDNPPIVTMADNRTMAQLLEAPTEGRCGQFATPELIRLSTTDGLNQIRLLVFSVQNHLCTIVKNFYREIISIQNRGNNLQPKATRMCHKNRFERYVTAIYAVLRNMQNQGQNLQSQMANLTDMLSKFVTANTASTSGSGTLPGNTVTNPKEDLKGRQPPVVQIQSRNPNPEPNVAPVVTPVPKASIPFPSRRNDEGARKNLALPELTPTCMTLELADRSITEPIGITKDVRLMVGRKDSNSCEAKNVETSGNESELNSRNCHPILNPIDPKDQVKDNLHMPSTELLPIVACLLGYAIAPGYIPKRVITERSTELNFNELRDQGYENSLIYKEKTKRIHDAKIKNRVFNVGDRVLLFNSRLKIFSGKLKSRWSGPFTIVQVFPYGTVELSQNSGQLKVNGHRIKLYFGGDVQTSCPESPSSPWDH
ncbi:hypothetical protein Tco_1018676 [Tanacetum coccineum]|uniref:Reverse transcriptase domain-containing protein n=1 Tax=Tanacetum coccineum TaxID=301880 RepID=A0ABQ5FUZ8_9ASTR